jgi:hypothetical protein
MLLPPMLLGLWLGLGLGLGLGVLGLLGLLRLRRLLRLLWLLLLLWLLWLLGLLRLLGLLLMLLLLLWLRLALRLLAAAAQQVIPRACGIHPAVASRDGSVKHLPPKDPQRLGEPLVSGPAVRGHPVGVLRQRRLKAPREGVLGVVHCWLSDVLQLLLLALRGDPTACCLPGSHALAWVQPGGARGHPVGPGASRQGCGAEATMLSPPKALCHHAVE